MSSLVRRPAPNDCAARPTVSASTAEIWPSARDRTGICACAWGNRLKLSHTLPSPPCAWIISRSLARPLPSSSFLRSMALADAASSAKRDNISICSPSSKETSSSGPLVRPDKTSIASLTSSALPTCDPSGSYMWVIRATTSRPLRTPISTIIWDNAIHCSTVFMIAPLPTLTSSTMPCAPPASFLDMILDAIRGIESTVAVTSRSAYSRLSAGTNSLVCPTTQQPTRLAMAINSSSGSSTRMPGMLSILSMVPPVWPKPRPLILITLPPHAATSGTSTKVVVSPTPPVECLSTGMPPTSGLSISPVRAIDMVSDAVSRASIPLRRIAIRRAAS